jgi:cell division protein FtsB
MEQLQQFWEMAYRFRRRLATWGLFLFAALIAAHVLFGTNGWMAYEQKKAEYRAVTEDLQKIQKENAQLEAQIKALKTDPRAIEREAREQLHYAKPGDSVYVIPTSNQSASSTVQAQKR